jgi:hypothetical protein
MIFNETFDAGIISVNFYASLPMKFWKGTFKLHVNNI